MALLKGKLFAGALFAGLLLGAPEPSVAPPVEIVQHTQQSVPGGGLYDSGQAWVQVPGHTWVKVVKAAQVKIKPAGFKTGSAGGGLAPAAKAKAGGTDLPAMGGSAARYVSASVETRHNSLLAGASGGSLLLPATGIASKTKIGFDYLGMDELLAVLMA